MDMSAYKETFLAEAREHIDNLNNGLLELEKNSTDETTINSIFRSFHTLKGNSATMGYLKFSVLAHDLENLLDKIRKKEMSVTTDIINVLFKGLDALEKGLELIGNDQSESFEATEVLNMVNALLPSQIAVANDVKISETAKLENANLQRINDLEHQGNKTHRIILSFDPNNMLKGPKATLVLNNMKNIGEIVSSTPKVDDIRLGKFGSEIEIIFSSKEVKEKLEQKINQISGMMAYHIIGLEEKYESKSQPKKESLPASSAPTQAAPPPAFTTATLAAKDASKDNVVKQVQEVRIDIKRLDYLMNMVGELLINKMRLEQINSRHQIAEMDSVLKTISRLTDDIQNEVIQDRMIPVGQQFNRFPRMVRDVALKEKKEVEFVMEGQDIMLDRTVIDKIGDPLVHLLRNCVDHGVETPEDRKKAGKSPQGIIKLIAKREKNSVVIEVIDDGEGIDPQKVKAAAVRKGTISKEEADKMNDDQLRMLIFRPGTSTNEVVTEVSGRGVGMDVVKTVIKSIGGSVKLESVVKKGTKITLQLPLTVSIITSLLVDVNNETYAIPLANVDKTVHVPKNEIKTIQGNKVFLLRDKELPLLSLSELLGKNQIPKETNVVVVVESGTDQYGLIVDTIISQQQILVKSLDENVKKTKGIAGATILGDGSVCLILDPGSLIS